MRFVCVALLKLGWMDTFKYGKNEVEFTIRLLIIVVSFSAICGFWDDGITLIFAIL